MLLLPNSSNTLSECACVHVCVCGGGMCVYVCVDRIQAHHNLLFLTASRQTTHIHAMLAPVRAWRVPTHPVPAAHCMLRPSRSNSRTRAFVQDESGISLQPLPSNYDQAVRQAQAAVRAAIEDGKLLLEVGFQSSTSNSLTLTQVTSLLTPRSTSRLHPCRGNYSVQNSSAQHSFGTHRHIF
jgi:hypothetical protein